MNSYHKNEKSLKSFYQKYCMLGSLLAKYRESSFRQHIISGRKTSSQDSKLKSGLEIQPRRVE